MNKSLFFTVVFLFFGACCFGQNGRAKNFKDISNDSVKGSTPFYSGLNGYRTFRIPTLIKTKKALIAFAEGRKNSKNDFGDIDLVYRRSLDGGKHWGPVQLLYDNDTLTAQNPVPVYIKSKNKLIVLFNTTSFDEHYIMNEDYSREDERKAYMTVSKNDGKSWNTPKNITGQVKKPSWRWHALGPVHGIELQYGQHKGRLVVPVAISIGKGYEAYCMALIYSDNQGNDWKIGAVDENLSDPVRSNETTIVELADGRIYINTRDHRGGSFIKNRGETYSLDGGLTFTNPIVESDKFPSPIVQSSLLRWHGKKNPKEDILLFSTPSNPEKRENLIIMSSYDQSVSWQTLFKVHHGFSAYSDMVQLNKRTLGVIYETDNYEKIRFRRIKFKR